MDVSIDAADLENMSADELRRKYDAQNRGSAGVPGSGNREDFSDMVAQEMSKKKQKMERDKDRDRDSGKKTKEYKF